jgi:hypothetical protein
VNYTRVLDGATVIAEYRVASDPNQSLLSEKTVLVIPQPYPNHNGGMVEFGPDGFLYIGMGDGGSRGDPENRGQNRDELLGKMFRIERRPWASVWDPERHPLCEGRRRMAFAIPGGPRLTAERRIMGWRCWTERLGGNRYRQTGPQLWMANHGGQPLLSTEDGMLDGGPRGSGGRVPDPPASVFYHGWLCVPWQPNAGREGTYLFGDFCSGEVFAHVKGRPCSSSRLGSVLHHSVRMTQASSISSRTGARSIGSFRALGPGSETL